MCSIVFANSPVFSPSRISLSCVTSPETLILAQYHHHASDGSPSSTSCGGASSPFRSLFQKGTSGFSAFKKEISATSSFLDEDSGPCRPASLNTGTGTSPLKRKRPARIDIPPADALTFTAAPPPGSNVRSEVEVEVDSARFSVFCKRGRRRVEMEDLHRADLDLHGDSQMAFFGIFDGHGGTKAAKFASENLGKLILEEVMGERVQVLSKLVEVTRERAQLLEVMRERAQALSELEEAVRSGYLKTDAEFLKGEVGGGTCCVTAVIKNGDVVVSNAGDCRAVLSRAGTAEALTSDHRPSRKDEKDRIESLGGYVDCHRGVWRLQGCLAVSRSIGDLHFKKWVIPEPETKILRIETECEFLILASDGLWDKVGNQEAVDIARPFCRDLDKPSPLSACKKLAELSAARGSEDDISVMIIQLGHFT